METPDAAAERLRKLLLVTDAALAHLSLEDLLDELLTRIREILDADTAAFLMLDERANELVARAAKGLEEEVVQGVRIPVGGGFAGRIADERHVVAVDDVDHADVLNPILREKGIKSLLGAPLLARGRVLGVVHVGTLTPRHFDAEDAELLQRAAERAALGVERALLHDELRRLDQVREQFVARASHELRTPATAVYGAAATLDARAGEVNPERLQLHERLSTIVEGFPDSSDIELRVPADLEAEIDPVAVDRVVTNLALNAIRHGAPPIVVAPELRGRLFEQFTRAPGASVPGTGLGLAIARAYAQAQGGDILHRDVSPSGSRFELVLPQPAVASPDSRMARR